MKKWEELDVLDNYLINVLASDPEVAEPFLKDLYLFCYNVMWEGLR